MGKRELEQAVKDADVDGWFKRTIPNRTARWFIGAVVAFAAVLAVVWILGLFGPGKESLSGTRPHLDLDSDSLFVLGDVPVEELAPCSVAYRYVHTGDIVDLENPELYEAVYCPDQLNLGAIADGEG